MFPENSQSIALNIENFKQVVIDGSQEKIVVTYFWSPRSEESVQMLSDIEALCAQYAQNMSLATVNTDEQPEIVQQFGVQELPTTILIKNGQPVDGFPGVQNREQLQETFSKHLPPPEQELLEKAMLASQEGELQQAFTFAKQAYDINPESLDARLVLADLAVETGQLESAKTVLETIKLAEQDTRYQSVVGKLELAEKAAESPELLALQEELAQSPDDADLKIKVAIALQQAHKTEQALTLSLNNTN